MLLNTMYQYVKVRDYLLTASSALDVSLKMGTKP